MNLKYFSGYILIALIITSCSVGKYAATEKIYKSKAKAFAEVYRLTPPKSQGLANLPLVGNKSWIGSVNYGIRKPNYVVIHHTAQDSIQRTIQTFLSEIAEVSAHYVIGRDGRVVQMVNDYFRAFHAGYGKWGNDTDMNSCSIGIELDNNGTTDPWPEVQINSLLELLGYLKAAYNIPQANFIGHADLAPTRKVDPWHFPWKQIADKGFSYWYDAVLEVPPADFNPITALRIIGYDITNPDAAIKAFKIHYIQENTEVTTLTDEELKIVYSIYKKFL